MHPNPAFRRVPEARSLAFARGRGFGTLAVDGGAAGPLLAHVPFLLSGDGREAETHLARPNPVLARLPCPAVLAVPGPEGYVSPDWYGIEGQVPTWNYVAVHLRGLLSPAPEGSLRGHLDRLSALFEERLPKPPWTAAKMDPDVLGRMMRAIVPVTLRVEGVEATWKLSQNKPEAARLGAAEGVSDAALGALMREPPG